jgi:hypothetical protein
MRRRHQALFPIRNAAVVLAPRHLCRVGWEISDGDAMADAILSATDAREK